LYVANSDFDLRYSGGTVQTIDLAALRARVDPISEALSNGVSAANACAQVGLATNAQTWLYPGPCNPFSVAPLIRSHAFIGAFASGVLLVHHPSATQARLFIPVRGDPSITYFEVQDDRQASAGFVPSYQLECQVDDEGFCGTDHRIGQDPDHTLRGIQLPADPVGIAATADGTAIVSAHQTKRAASLLINDWQSVPWLSYFAGNLPEGPTEVVTIPEPAFVAAARAEAAADGRSFLYRNGFALTFRYTAEVDILQYYPDSGASPPRPFIARSGAAAITINASGADSRGIAIVDTERRACEADCGDPLDVSCQQACAENVPLRVFVANRAPASLLIGELNTIVNTRTETVPGQSSPQIVPSGAFETLYLYDSIPMTFGPSRVETGSIVNEQGQLEPRVFAVCFDSRSIYVFDPLRDRLESVIRTGRGPHDIAFDTGEDDTGRLYSYLYVGHFTDSYIGVVDLDRRRPLTYAQLFASVGIPTPPQESN